MWCRKLSLGKIGVMDMSYIMDSGQKWLYPTFRNIFWSLSAKSADLSKNQKNHFFKKNEIFLVENLPEKGQNWFNSKTTIVPSPHEHSLQTHNYDFLDMGTMTEKENISKNHKFPYPKIIIVGL